MSFIKQDVLHYDTDVLVIGGGSAGLRAALAARAKGARVLVVNRGGSHSGGSTAYLDKLIEFTGLGVSVGSSESQLYYEELRSYGKEINSDQLLKVFSADDEEELKFLESIGVQFQREGNDYKWIKLPSHTRPRVLRGMEDFGTEILKRMVKACQDAGVEFLTHTQVYRVVKDSQGRPRVALAIRKEAEGQAIQIRFSSIVLATGGFGNLFSYNTNPQGYGSGMAMALDLGARLTNLEFVQILPLLVKPIRGFFIISSLLSQGKVSNTAGELFNPSAPISSANDTVLHAEIVFELCRWIEKQQEQGQVTAENGVYWNGIELKDQMERLIPRSLEVLKARGLDLTREPAVISVGYHQALGGIAIGTSGQTDIPGLFACGECAGGFQGAERMMGTGVRDALVFGRRAGRAAAEAIDGSGPDQGLELEQGTKSGALPIAYEDATRQLQNAMDKILVTKNSTKLQAVKREIDQLKGIVDQVPLESVPLREKVRLAELKDALLIASAYITACEARKESRGSFLRSDYPQEDPEFAAASYIWKEGKDQFQVSFDQ